MQQNSSRRPSHRVADRLHGFRLFALAVVLGASSIPANAKDRPNVLLIISDDQGYPDLGFLGHKPLETPNLDRLAAKGVYATDFSVTWPACTPSRGSLLTGRYPQRNGLYDMVRNDMVNYGHKFTPEEYAVSPEMTLGLDTREVTIGDMLSKAGYRCGTVGKWDMGQARRYLPLQRGFEFFYGHGNNGIDYFTHERYGVPSLFRGNVRTTEDCGDYATTLFQREAIRFLEQKDERPWFLYLAFNAPHGASSFDFKGVQALDQDIDRFRGRVPKESLLGYYAALYRMDAAIGAVLDQLSKNGEDKNTFILFLSDNGGSGNGGNAPLKGRKGQMWEGGLRVPFLAAWPGRLPEGRVVDSFFTSLELFPTILTACDIPVPSDLLLDGHDVLPLLKGEDKSPRREMFWERRLDRAARLGNWKWISTPRESGLFDLAADPGETTDLTASHPEIAADLEKRFQHWRDEMLQSEPRGPFRDY
jgi:arylsulfatase A-like enzyme